MIVEPRRCLKPWPMYLSNEEGLNETIVLERMNLTMKGNNSSPGESTDESSEASVENQEVTLKPEQYKPNQGSLLLDASCAPASSHLE